MSYKSVSCSQCVTLPHWFQYKALQFYSGGRRPKGLIEWARCLWNADIFIGPVPFMKLLAVLNFLILYVLHL